MDTVPGAGPVRDEFETIDPDVAEDWLRRAYLDNKLTIAGQPEQFTLHHSTLRAPRFSIDTLQTGVDLVVAAEGRPDELAFHELTPLSPHRSTR